MIYVNIVDVFVKDINPSIFNIIKHEIINLKKLFPYIFFIYIYDLELGLIWYIIM
jgi:hypothetical protein